MPEATLIGKADEGNLRVRLDEGKGGKLKISSLKLESLARIL